MDDSSQDDDAAEDTGTGPLGNPAGQIRALARGLAALEALNRQALTNQAGASVTEIANATGLARTTAYRVLETLCAAGLAARTHDDRYCLLAAVYRLSDGFDAEPWIARVAKPVAANLAKDLAWPLMLATLHGAGLKVHCLGEAAVEIMPARRSLTTSAAGLAYLAAMPEAQRTALLAVLKASGEIVGAEFQQTLADIAARGAAKVDRDADVGLAVPVKMEGGVIGSLGVTMPRAALAPDLDQGQALDRITALLTHAAAEIAAALGNTSPAIAK
ncbi:MAG: helix-turn-helix domain-containing protein [Rhodospirillaceae bacterium]